MTSWARIGSAAAATAAVLALTGIAPASATTAVVMCGGQEATIVGTEGDDSLDGTSGNDVIAGLGGEDDIDGGNGDDIICGGPGAYSDLSGGEGNDQLFIETPGSVTGDDGDDTIDGTGAPAGRVTVSYFLADRAVEVDLRKGTAVGEGNDTLIAVSNVFGSYHDDTILGDDTDNYLHGGFRAFDYQSNDTLVGRGGDDHLDGDEGVDDLKGGAGADNLYGGPDDDVYHGGTGADFLFESASDVSDDELYGGRGGDYLYGGAGVDLGDAGSGEDLCKPDIETQVGCETSQSSVDASEPGPAGEPWAWGRNFGQELGDGCVTFQPASPVRVVNLTSVTMIRAGGLALDADGQVWAWGDNDNGQLGDGSTDAECEPKPVPRIDDAVSIDTAPESGFAIRADARLWAWGRNEGGQLGDGTTTDRLRPVQTKKLKNVVAVDAGPEHTLALKKNGTVKSWGANNYGELGDGTTQPQLTPQKVPGLSDVVAISAGGHFVDTYEPYAGFSLALTADGTVWAWGDNAFGQLGDGTITERHVPTEVTGLADVTAVSAGGTHSLALLADGTIWAWGDNEYGQLGDAAQRGDSRVPQQVPGLDDFVLVEAGDETSLAVRSDGIAFGWGRNDFGQVGAGLEENKVLEPTQVVGLTGVTSIDQGGEASFAVAESGPE